MKMLLLHEHFEPQPHHFPFCKRRTSTGSSISTTYKQESKPLEDDVGMYRRQQPLSSSIRVSPTPYHPLGAQFGITPASQMTVDETANWIWTLGWYYGWEEAHGYHDNFRDNKISGILLPKLTLIFLKSKLGIGNERHRWIIIYTIRKLFPNINGENPEYLSPYSYVTIALVPSANIDLLDCQHRVCF